MAAASSWVTGHTTLPTSQLIKPFSFIDSSAAQKSKRKGNSLCCFVFGWAKPGGLVSHSPRARSRSSNSSSCCRCTGSSVDTSSGGSSYSDWDWNRWSRHFSEIEQAESFASVLKFQLEEAIEKEDFHDAAKLKRAIAEATSVDAVSEIMFQLKDAIEEERYHDASKLCKFTGSGLVGWWVGYPKDSDDPFGRLICITPGVGRFVGRSYTPKQLVTASSGTPLFEIFVVKEADETYVMQAAYLHRTKGSSAASSRPSSKSSKAETSAETDDTPAEDMQESEVKTETNDEKGLNIEGATEETIKSVINFLKEKIPELKVKVMNINVSDEVIEETDSLKQLIQEDDEDTSSVETSDSEDGDDLEGILTDEVVLAEADSSKEDEKDLGTKLFLGGVVHNEEAPSKDEFVRLPAKIKDMERDSFLLHIPGQTLDQDSRTSKVSEAKVAAIAAQGISELMPSEIAKEFWGVTDKVSSKGSRNVREIVKLAVSKAEKRKRLSEFTTFNRINTSRGDLDPFDGLYVGAFGPYGTEVVQLRRKFGHWNSGNDDDSSSEVEFFEYVEAVKLTGDLNVPAGQVTFRAKIGKAGRTSNREMYPDELGVVASYKGQGRIAEIGFRNPKWVEGALLQMNGKGTGLYNTKGADLGFLYVVPGQSFLVLFNRLRLPD